MWGQVFDPSGRAKLDPLLLWRGRPRPRCLREGHGFSRADKSLTPFVILSERALCASRRTRARRVMRPPGAQNTRLARFQIGPRFRGRGIAPVELLGGAALQRCIKAVYMNTGFSP
jgi:hypothetical protein